MKKEISILVGLTIFFVLFIFAGFPLLRDVKEDLGTGRAISGMSGENDSDADFLEVVDISEERICVDSSGETDIRCQTRHGCDALCSMRGCSEFGMVYNSSRFDNKCECVCYEEGADIVEEGSDIDETEDGSVSDYYDEGFEIDLEI